MLPLDIFGSRSVSAGTLLVIISPLLGSVLTERIGPRPPVDPGHSTLA